MMRLSEMKQLELLEVAQEFGTDATQDLNEQQIITRLMEDGVTQDMVNTFLEGKEAKERAAREAEEARLAEVSLAQEEEAPPAKKGARKRSPKETVATVAIPDQVLVYMDRENPTYKIRGYTFTREHPFALVGEVDAEFIVEHEEGFTYATPKQAREFYGG